MKFAHIMKFARIMKLSSDIINLMYIKTIAHDIIRNIHNIMRLYQHIMYVYHNIKMFTHHIQVRSLINIPLRYSQIN